MIPEKPVEPETPANTSTDSNSTSTNTTTNTSTPIPPSNPDSGIIADDKPPEHITSPINPIPQPPDQKGANSSKDLLIGILSILLLMVVVLLVIFCLHQRRKSKKLDENQEGLVGEQKEPEGKSLRKQTKQNSKLMKSDPEDVEKLDSSMVQELYDESGIQNEEQVGFVTQINS